MKIIFPCVFLFSSERAYYGSKFALGLQAILDRFNFGISWDLNCPDTYFEVNILDCDKPTKEQITELIKRVNAFLKRQQEKGTISL